MTTEPFPLIEVSGPPNERGRSYGRQAATRIHRGIEHYGVQLERQGLEVLELARLVRQYLPIIERFDVRYIEEMRGIATGADVPFEQIVFLNARTEILKLAQRPELRASLQADEPDGCTGVIVMPEATAGGHLLHAQNWDWKSECAETAVMLRIQPDRGPALLTFTEAGGLARSGLNAVGIALTANYLESDLDYRTLGVPLALIRRKVLESEHFALAAHAIYTTLKSGSNNMMLSHADGFAMNFECAPGETFVLYPEGGLLVHANHWVHTAALSKLRDTGVANMPDTLYRDRRVRDLLAPRLPAIDVEAVKSALLDDRLTPWSVCRPPRRGVTEAVSATVASIVMSPVDRLIEVAPLPALGMPYCSYRL